TSVCSSAPSGTGCARGRLREREARRVRELAVAPVDRELAALRPLRRDLLVHVGVRREHARPRARVAAAVEAARVADDERAGGTGGEDPVAGRDRRLELLRRRVALALTPRPEVAVLEPLRALPDVLERPGFLVHVAEVEEHLDDVLVLGVAVPLLRRNALGVVADGDRVPEVEVDELDLRAAVGVDDPEQRVAGGVPEPRPVRREDRRLDRELLLSAPVAPDQEPLLAFRADAVLELVLGAGDELVHV